MIWSGLAVAIAAFLYVFTLRQARAIARRYPPAGAFVAVTGGRLHYTEQRPLEAPRAVVVLLHGASGNQADLMLPLGDGLVQARFRVLAFDRPGLGWSDRPGARQKDWPVHQARLVAGALERLGVRQAIIVAHSLAGTVATQFALDHGGMVAGLVLVAPVTHPWPRGEVSWYYPPAAMAVVGWLFTRLLTLPAGLFIMPRALGNVFAPQQPPAHYMEATGLPLVLRPATFRANAQDVADLYPFITAQAKRLGEINAPTAIVTGDHDGIVLTHIHSYGSLRDIPGATLEVLEGVGHSPHWVAPGAVIRAVEDVAARSRKAAGLPS